MNIFKRISTLILVMTVVCCKPIFAQTIADTLHLPEIVVVEKFSDREIRSTAPFQILTNKTIQNLNVLQLSDAVKFLAGTTVKDYGGIGGLKTVSVRSLGAAHTAINYNGIAVSDVQTGQIDIGRFSLDQIDNISLMSGQSDQIFMPARAFSLSSALNINTITPQFKENKNSTGKVKLQAGSFGLVNPAFTVSNKLSTVFKSRLSGEWMSANGAYPYKLHYGTAATDSSSIEKRNNSDVENFRIEGALFGNFSDRTQGNIRLYYYRSERGLPGATILYNTANYSKQRLWDKTFFVQGHLEHRFSPRWVIQANAKYNRGYLRYLDSTYLGSSGKVEDIFNQNESYGSLAVLYRAFEQLSFSAATDLSAAAMTSNRINFADPVRYTSQSVVAAKWMHEYFLATASVLYTQTSESVQNGNAAQNHNKVSPYAGFSVKPFDAADFRIRAFYKNSFRLPTFNDLYYPSVGVRKLKPEDAHQFNLGLTYSTSVSTFLPWFKITADAYANKVNNKIIAYPTSNLHQWAMMNLGIVKIKGLDIAAESAARFAGQTNLTFGATYTYQEAKDKTDAAKSTYNHRIPYTPQHSGSARAALELPWFKVACAMLWSGSRYYNAYNSSNYKLSGYTDYSLSVSKDFETRIGLLGIHAEALNLSDKNYEIVRNYPMPGRSYRVSLSLNF